jgi:hypothetical protein
MGATEGLPVFRIHRSRALHPSSESTAFWTKVGATPGPNSAEFRVNLTTVCNRAPMACVPDKLALPVQEFDPPAEFKVHSNTSSNWQLSPDGARQVRFRQYNQGIPKGGDWPP